MISNQQKAIFKPEKIYKLFNLILDYFQKDKIPLIGLIKNTLKRTLIKSFPTTVL